MMKDHTVRSLASARMASFLSNKKKMMPYLSLGVWIGFALFLLTIPISNGKAHIVEWTPAWADLGDSGTIHNIAENADPTDKLPAPSSGFSERITQFFASNGQPIRAPSKTSDGWTTIFSDDLEGTFPGDWNVFDNDGATNGTYFWAQKDCRPYEGSKSAWVVGGGADGSALTCGSDYPDYAKSWMIYGPFSLADATDAEFRFMFWLNSEPTFDVLFAGASINGNNFYGATISGIYDWTERIFDLTNVFTLGDLTGQPEVWVVIAFQSDFSNYYSEGVFVDNIEIIKFVGEEPTATQTATSASPTTTTTFTPTTPTATFTPTASQTPEPKNSGVYLPLVMNYQGPTPTPTITLTPTITSTPTITPTPTATSEGVVPNDGNWSGTTSQGRSITWVVVSNGTEIDTITLNVGWGGACGGVSYTTYFLYDAVITNGHFYKSQGNGTDVEGTFTSATSANGDFSAVLEVFYPFYCKATTSGTWSADYVP